MELTRELLDGEIRAAESQLAQAQSHLDQVKGALNVMRQLRDLLDKPEPEAQDAQEQGDSLRLPDPGSA